LQFDSLDTLARLEAASSTRCIRQVYGRLISLVALVDSSLKTIACVKRPRNKHLLICDVAAK